MANMTAQASKGYTCNAASAGAAIRRGGFKALLHVIKIATFPSGEKSAAEVHSQTRRPGFLPAHPIQILKA